MAVGTGFEEVFNKAMEDADGAEGDISAKLSSDIASGLAKHTQQSLDSGTTAEILSYTGTCAVGSVDGTATTVKSTSFKIVSSAGTPALTTSIQNAFDTLYDEGKKEPEEVKKAVTDCAKSIAKAIIDFTEAAICTDSAVGTAVPPAVPPPTVPCSGAALATLSFPSSSALESDIEEWLTTDFDSNAKAGTDLADKLLAAWEDVEVESNGLAPILGLSATSTLSVTS